MKKDRNKVNPGSHQPFFPPSMLLLSLLAQLFHPVPGTGSGFSPTCLHRQAAACPNQLLPGATQRPAHSLPAHSPPATGSGSQGSCLSLPTAASYTEYGRRMRRRYARADLWEPLSFGEEIKHLGWGTSLTFALGMQAQRRSCCRGARAGPRECRRDTSPGEQQQQGRARLRQAPGDNSGQDQLLPHRSLVPRRSLSVPPNEC